MNKYRDVEYSLYAGNYIKLFYLRGKCPVTAYPNGEKYISIPDAYKDNVDLYARRMIDRLYDWADCWVSFETRERLK